MEKEEAYTPTIGSFSVHQLTNDNATTKIELFTGERYVEARGNGVKHTEASARFGF